MTTTSEEAAMSLLDKAEQALDSVYIQAKEIIKAQREMITNSIERIKRHEEMDEEERKSCLDLYIEDCKWLMKSIQDITKSMERGKGEMEMREKEKLKKESKELYAVVRENNVKKFKFILKRGRANVDWQNEENGWTSLMGSSNEGHLEICELLIEAGAKVDLQSNAGCSALYIASLNGYLEICKLLMEAGAKVDLQRNDGSSALCIASFKGHLEICKLLIQSGAIIDLQNNYGTTALSWACYYGHKEVASFLLAEGSAYTFKDKWGKTAGDYAVERNGWNWNAMIAESILSFFDQVFDCMINADDPPLVEKKKGRKRKRGEEEEEKKEELPFLLKFMKRVYFSDLMMSKYVFPKLSLNPGAEGGEGKFD